MIHIADELFGDEEACPRDHPVIGIAIEKDAARRRRFDRRGVGEEQMPPAEHRTRRIERAAMLLQIGPLDEIAAILLVDRHEHADDVARSEEHTSELQSLMRILYAVFCLKKKTHQ